MIQVKFESGENRKNPWVKMAGARGKFDADRPLVMQLISLDSEAMKTCVRQGYCGVISHSIEVIEGNMLQKKYTAVVPNLLSVSIPFSQFTCLQYPLHLISV